MIKKIKSTILALSMLLAIGAPLALPAMASAAIATDDKINNGACQGANLSVDTSGTCDQTKLDTGTTQVDKIVKLVVNLFSVAVGIIAVIMIIIGGLKYITSGGESANVTGAKNTILYAVVGLVIVALAQFIVRFVLGKVNN